LLSNELQEVIGPGRQKAASTICCLLYEKRRISTLNELLFTLDSELETFAKRGGFEAEDIMYEAEIQKVLLKVSKLESEIEPGLYQKIMKILEPLAKLTGLAADLSLLA